LAAARLAFLFRADWLNRRRVRDYALIFLAVFLAAAVWFHAGTTGLVDRRGQPVGTDFINVYAAGVMVGRGDAPGAYRYTRHHLVEREVVGNERIPYFGWHYPPMFLGVAWLLAQMPYATALALYLAATFALLALVVWRIAPHPLTLLVLLAFPGTFVNLGHGQNAFLTAALLGGGLLLLERRPIVAGVLLGLLSYKPQFGLLIPVALLAGLHIRAILAAGATVIAVCLLSLGLFGMETWKAFFASTALTQDIILEQGATGWAKIQSSFSMARSLGAPLPFAYGLQFVVTALAALAVIWTWRAGRGRSAVDYAVKASVLCVAILLSPPYLLDYDLVVLALPIAFMTALGARDGFRDWERVALLAAWLLPIVSRGLGGAIGVQFAPLVLAAILLVLLQRVREPAKAAA
jgi:alpha-1,2-mannosyltransferase